MNRPVIHALAAVVSVAFANCGFAQYTQVRQASYQQSPSHQVQGPGMRYFTSNQSQLGQQPGQMAGHQASFQPTNKPFQDRTPAPTLSPYMNLDRLETSVGLPNYHTFVRPQLQQQLAEQSEQAQLRRLRQQQRVANARSGGAPGSSMSVPTTGRSTQFLNMGSYFPVPR